ncbi:MAG: hypothetical protein M1816_000711 [Peltula sp. TS41687]|nr:MAG: hypothetical protein M1816_000711 [Peltula sp. TS41687]
MLLVDEDKFVKLFEELESRELPVKKRMEVLREQLPPPKRHPYALWAFHRHQNMLRDKARTSVLIDKIKHTDFLNIDSRKELARHWMEACQALPPTEPRGNHVPIGRHHGRLYAFAPSDHFSNSLSEDTDDKFRWGAARLAAAQLEIASGFYRGLYIRTYDQMSSDSRLLCEAGKPECLYGRCSGTGLVGCTWAKWNDAGDLRVASPLSARSVSGSSTGSTTLSSTTASLRLISPASSSHSTATDATVDDTLRLDRPFFCLGALIVGETIGEDEEVAAAAAAGGLGPDKHRWNYTHYFVAVSLADCSVWLVYEAWSQLGGDEDYDDYDDVDDEDGYPGDETPPPDPIRRIRFRPERDIDWARLRGDHRRRTMAKLAAHVHDWHIGSFANRMTVDGPAIPESSFMVASDVHEDKDGNLFLPA